MGKLGNFVMTAVFVLVCAGLIWWRAWDSLFIWAADNEAESLAKALLATGAKVDATYIAGETALSIVARKGDSAMVKLLVSHGAKVNALDNSKVTPLSEAVSHGHAEVVSVLLAAGADPTLPDRQGKTAFDKVPADKPELAQLLKDAAKGR
jgi:ankyrin repeat protein